ncbi:TraR/DksA C4-type zinc finger protein [Asanoa sp. NPDC049518]|uniref:TraR/DksA family transcriptional regulator n=1 Tax=unclassified Asanoa TaxID=2685164 RepID=UPI0034366621
MTLSTKGRLHGVHLVLQELFEQQTGELVKLDGYRTDPQLTGLTPRALDELTATAREALAETAAALKRMNDGTYGTCQHCGQDIPLERLEILPTTRFCVPCQQLQRTHGGRG